MMSRWFLLVWLAIALVGCGATSQPKLALPGVPASKARLVFYRDGNPYHGLAWTRVSLNGERIGASAPGTVFYRDVAPGVYRIAVDSEKLYPDQVKAVMVDAGSTTFIKVVGLPFWGQSGVQWWGYTFTVAVIAPAIGQYEIGPLHLTSG
ncbi:MAG TPA: DUF2846 domain-containing protein [Stellaceae bacterium]|nr:DUF2846 domain-containing protein [Stellaceae bacterium]